MLQTINRVVLLGFVVVSLSLPIYSAAAPNGAAAVTPPEWGPAAELFGPLIADNGETQYSGSNPMFDGQGNAYQLIMTYAATTSAAVVQSNGNSGTWGAPQTVYTSANYLRCSAVVDPQGDVIVLCLEQLSQSAGFQVLAIRYTAAAGWLSPVVLYTGATEPEFPVAVADATGDVVVVVSFLHPGTHNSASSYVFSAATQQWLPPTEIVPLVSPQAEALNITLQANRVGTAIFLAYIDRGLAAVGLYAQRFDIATLAWDTAQAIPGSSGPPWTMQYGDSSLPLAVDGSGTASLVFNILHEDIYHADVRVSRYQNGSWTPATQLFEADDVEFWLDEYSAADANNTESAAAATGYLQDGTEAQYVFLYNGTQWSTQIAVQYPNTGTQGPVSFAFTGTGNASVLTYVDAAGNESVYSDGTGWSAPVALGGVLGTDILGQTVLYYVGEVNGQNYFLASWLQN
jgi:hypothetical protein